MGSKELRLILSVFTYGPDQRRTEIELRPIVPESARGNPKKITDWVNMMAMNMAPDFKHTNEWGCEICGPPKTSVDVPFSCDGNWPENRLTFDFHADISPENPFQVRFLGRRKRRGPSEGSSEYADRNLCRWASSTVCNMHISGKQAPHANPPPPGASPRKRGPSRQQRPIGYATVSGRKWGVHNLCEAGSGPCHTVIREQELMMAKMTGAPVSPGFGELYDKSDEVYPLASSCAKCNDEKTGSKGYKMSRCEVPCFEGRRHSLRRVIPAQDARRPTGQGWIRTPPKSSSVQIEEIPEQSFSSIGATTGVNGTLLEDTLLEPPLYQILLLPVTRTYRLISQRTRKDVTFGRKRLDPDPAQIPLPDDSDDSDGPPPLVRIRGNRRTRRAWLRAGRIEHLTDDLWCAAGYTFSQQIAEEAFKSKPHAHVFSEKESERLPEHQLWDHAIDFLPNAPPTLRTKVYPMSPNEQQELIRFLEENLQKGYIHPSKSPLASPVFFVKKKDGKLRFVQDYRKLNEITVKNRYPLPLVSDIINRLQGAKYQGLFKVRSTLAKYFSKFDVRWGYNNVRIKEGDGWKAAFATNQGLFEPLVMFFSLTNSPATFQALMNSIFADLIVKGKVAVYLDDILIFTATLEEHREIVNEVLTRLRKHDLYLRPEKCEFEKTEIEYLGLVIRKGEIRMDPAKVEAVRNWPIPKNLREVRGFLGFANFYRRFIKNFSKIAGPLNDLTKKDTPW
ncbi:hypothetical protein NMY22_g304 [Coprinellus aureogranulatus]|nr:hypothetical protein NMY22_g304 [Coprinellus aureogranulatus]